MLLVVLVQPVTHLLKGRLSFAKRSGACLTAPDLCSSDQMMKVFISLYCRSLEQTSSPDLRLLAARVDALNKLNPTPNPSESPLINGTWVLLYTAKLNEAARGENLVQVSINERELNFSSHPCHDCAPPS